MTAAAKKVSVATQKKIASGKATSLQTAVSDASPESKFSSRKEKRVLEPTSVSGESEGVFAGRFLDLKPLEQISASWRSVHPVEMFAAEVQSSTRTPPPNQVPTTVTPRKRNIKVKAPSFNVSASKLTESDEIGLYLIRSSKVTAAQALSQFDVTFQTESRARQLLRLKSFRRDTSSASCSEVERWISERLPGRPSQKSSGTISSGIVVPMSHDEARILNADVSNLFIMRNRALSLISPTLSSLPNPKLPPSAAWHLEAIGMLSARRDGKAYSGAGVTVALMDTGVQLDHPEIAGKVLSSWKIRDNPATTDFQALELDKKSYDTDGHGTHVAGLICGTTVGVAPDARLISILMMPRRLATLFDYVRCLDWASEHPEVSLINFSAGITPFASEMMPFVSDVIKTGALPIFAIGNEGPNNTRSPGNFVDGASVGSVDAPGQQVSSFSGSGQMLWNQTVYNVPDLVAPGGQIWSSYPGTKYVAMSGTSMASPVACGVAACLIEQADGQLSPLELMDQLRRGCSRLVSETDVRQGAGIVQVPQKP